MKPEKQKYLLPNPSFSGSILVFSRGGNTNVFGNSWALLGEKIISKSIIMVLNDSKWSFLSHLSSPQTKCCCWICCCCSSSSSSFLTYNKSSSWCFDVLKVSSKKVAGSRPPLESDRPATVGPTNLRQVWSIATIFRSERWGAQVNDDFIDYVFDTLKTCRSLLGNSNSRVGSELSQNLGDLGIESWMKVYDIHRVYCIPAQLIVGILPTCCPLLFHDCYVKVPSSTLASPCCFTESVANSVQILWDRKDPVSLKVCW